MNQLIVDGVTCLFEVRAYVIFVGNNLAAGYSGKKTGLAAA